MALSISYPVSAAAGVGPPGTSSADYGLLGKMGLSTPYTPMVGSSVIGWKPPTTIGGATPGATPGVGGAGIPMPAVSGYKYVYPWYRWEGETEDSSAGYKRVGHKEDRDAFDYFPYFPGTEAKRAYSSGGSPLSDMLVGVSLIRS